MFGLVVALSQGALAQTGTAASEAKSPSSGRQAAYGPPRPGAAAAGGDSNLVWTNTRTKVYHCPGSPYYGRTSQGAYADESEAVAKGFRSSTRKPCTL